MLKNRDGWFLELTDQTRRRADVENVIKRKLFPVKLFKMFIKIAVESGGLMRIFPVAQARHQRQGEGE